MTARRFGRLFVVLVTAPLGVTSAFAQTLDPGPSSIDPPPDTTSAQRPFVRGGYDDKPYLEGFFGRIRLGGYVEANGVWEREDGATDELGVELTRINLLTSTDIRGRVQVWSEIEFEEGGEEIVVELAQVDVRLHPATNLRGGILLLPLGRFNLAHDGPRNELPLRPLLATDLIGTAVSQPGLGLFGQLQRGSARLTYEGYGITGYDHLILGASPDGTRLPAGRLNREDSNASPAWVARVELGASQRGSLGLSGYTGAYNVYRTDGLEVDERREVHIGVADLETSLGGITISGEGALIAVEIPPGLEGLFASRQGGLFVQMSRPFGRGWIGSSSSSWFTAAVRGDVVDFDRRRTGDSARSITFGLNFRPVPESVLKLAFTRGESRDRFNNLGTNAAWVFGLSTYF